MTDPLAVAAKEALNDWPICVHPRLGIGPTYDDIGRWFSKHAATLREALEQIKDADGVLVPRGVLNRSIGNIDLIAKFTVVKDISVDGMPQTQGEAIRRLCGVIRDDFGSLIAAAQKDGKDV